MNVFLLAPLLLCPLEDPITLEPTLFATHERPVVALGAGVSKGMLLTLTDDGVLHAYVSAQDEFAWSQAPSIEVSPPAKAWDHDFFFGVGKKTVARAPEQVASCQVHTQKAGKALLIIATSTVMQGTGGIAVDPKDRWVWIGTKQGAMTRVLIDSSSGWSNRPIGNGGVTSLAIDSKGKEVAIGGLDGTLRFVGNQSCNVDEKTVFEGHAGPVTALAWSPDGKTLASGDGKGLILLRSRRGGKQRQTWTLPDTQILAFAFHPKNKWLAARSADGTIVLWNVKSGEPLARAKIEGKTNGNHSLLVVDKGGRLLSAGAGNQLVSFETSALK